MRFFALGFVFLLGAAGNGGGCSNPNAIGVQQYGTIVGRVLDATNNRPVPNTLVSVGSIYTGYTDAQGAFALSQIPIGQQDVTASAPGYQRNSLTAVVHQDKTTDVGYLRIEPVTGGPTAPPPPTAAPPTPIPTPVPVLTPAPSPSAAASATP